MEKLKMQTEDIAERNFKKLCEMFPNAVTEGMNENGEIVRSIDKDILMQEISCNVVEGSAERYQFTWPDKRKSIILANTSINKTLRPCREDSRDFDKTQNLYIEGDNLEVLKLLSETYLGKVKMIYIDPPYNTGKDFVYRDDFAMSSEEYADISNQTDEEGNRLFQNTDSDGRFHTNWLNMIYPRLKVARDLLSDDGIIFISIDDNEVNNLIKVCDEIFGRNNFVAQIVVEGTPKNDPKIISTAHEYCLVYVKNYEVAKDCNWGVKNDIYRELVSIVERADTYQAAEEGVKKYYTKQGLANDNIANYCNVDEKGLYRTGPIDDPQGAGGREDRFNPLTGEKLKTPNRGWRCTIDTWNEWVKNGEILFPETNDKLCSRKIYVDPEKLDLLRAYFKVQIRKDTNMLINMFGEKVFQFPKPMDLISAFVDSSVKKDGIVLDFFSGSATTAHAVMRLNATDGGHRKFICVQLPENLEMNLKMAQGNREKQTAKNAIEFCRQNNLPPYITEIGKERIRRAGDMIKRENPNATDLDIGFRVLKVDSSNMKDVYYTPSEYTENIFDMLEDNIKEDRTPEDLLFQVMLDLGVDLASKIVEQTIEGKQVFDVADNYLLACFDNGLTNEVITSIAKKKPAYFIMRDSSAENDSVAINFDQIFETYSKETQRKVL